MVAEADLKISDAAFRLLCRILSHVTRNAYRMEMWEPFPLTCSMVALWCGVGDRQGYNLLAELERRGYLKHHGILGCPGKAHYRVVEAMAEKWSGFKKPENAGADSCGPSTAKNCSPSPAKNCKARAAKNFRDHISNSFQEKMSTPRGRNGSLRSTGNEGEKVGSLRSKVKLTDEQRQRLAEQLRAHREKLK